MSGPKPAFPAEIREHLVSRVLDRREKLKPLVEQLNRGELGGFPATPVSYSAAANWVSKARTERDSTAPLEDQLLDDFTRRIWAVALRELRKAERDSAKSKPLDVKRLNDLEGVATRLRRHLHRRDVPEAAKPDDTETATPSPLLHTLAAKQTARSEPEPAASDLHKATNAQEQPTVAQQQGEPEPTRHGDQASRAHSVAA